MDGGMVHLVAGALGGTVGAVLTCPLEVVKTRLQSSNLSSLANRSLFLDASLLNHNYEFAISEKPKLLRLRLSSSLRNIVGSEGISGLFKGLGPNIIGVAPSRAIYFGAYAHTKSFLNSLDLFGMDTPIVHFFSAASAGFSSSTITNPIWLVKTRLQLNTHVGMSMWQCCMDILTKEGWRGFYKGLTASYYGISETIIHLVIYEEIKFFLNNSRLHFDGDNDDPSYENVKSFVHQFFDFMMAGAISKTIATCVAYPHEVARTRLREQGSKYKGFWKTLSDVIKEEGPRGIYRGLATQLVRQIPNTALTMATYEAVVYLAGEYYKR